MHTFHTSTFRGEFCSLLFRSRAPLCSVFWFFSFVLLGFSAGPFWVFSSAPCGLFGVFGRGAFWGVFLFVPPVRGVFPVSLIFCFVLSSPLLLLFPFVCFLRPHTHARKPTPFWETTGSGFSPGPRGSVPPGRPLRPRGLETPCTGKLYTLVFRIIMPQGHLLRASARLRHGRWTIAAFAFFFPFPLPVSRFLLFSGWAR